jgi:hypothetical protein
MHRRAVALLLATVGAGAAAGCGGEDNRPLELEYLTEAIFAPACGATQCHSTFRQAEGFVFDTPDAVRRSLLVTETGGTNLLRFDYERPDPSFSFGSRLIELISLTVPFPESPELPRMPLDAPMPNKDIELLRLWIKDPASGAPFGVGGHGLGAQCEPDLNPHGYACDRDRVVTCGDDWNFGDTLTVCPRGCLRTFPTVCHDPNCPSMKPSECEVPCDPENPEDMCRE